MIHWKIYRKKNKREISRRRKQHYILHREKMLKQSKKYRKTHKKEIKNYYLKNKERFLKQGEKYKKSPAGIYSAIKYGAKIRNISFDLKLNEFVMWYKNQKRICVYCKRYEKELIKDKCEKFHRLSIDRKDNNCGYSIDNLALCCYRCNEVKSNVFTYKQMIKVGRILYNA